MDYTPNQQQIESVLRVLLAVTGPIAALIMSYGVQPTQYQLWTNALVAVLPPVIAAIWGVVRNTHKQTIADAAKVPGVTEIRVADNAKGGAQAAAADTSLPTVKPVSAP